MTNNNISCFIQNESNETKVKYLCEIPGDTTAIKNIKIKEPGFNNFNIKLTPLASGCMNNLDHENNLCNKELNNLNEIYILQNAICEKKGNSLIIKGTILNNENNELPSFTKTKKELSLSTKELPSKNETIIKCFVDKLEEGNYTLNCSLKPNTQYEFDNSILFDDDKIMIINFENGTESQIITDEIKPKRYYKRSSGKLSSGIIALIIIVPVVLLAMATGLAFYFRKHKEVPKIPVSVFSTTDNIRSN